MNFLRAIAAAARPACCAAVRCNDAPLGNLPIVEVTIVSDRTIAELHERYLADPAPTDVITFPHGEIFIGAGTVAENAGRYQTGVSEEAARCLIHGLLHLAGWDDLTQADAKDMETYQEEIFNAARRMIQSRP